MIELFVENKRIDIDKGFSTLLTLAIDDIKDFGAKNTTFSKTIILPGTKSNNINFGNIFNVNARNNFNPNEDNIGLNFNAAISAQAYIFADNLQVFKGIFRILEIVIDDGFIEYECAVFGELGGFVAKLGNHKLEQLDFSAYNQNYTYANITSTTNIGTGAGLVYPLIDYGNYSTAKHDWNYKTFRPALHVKEYIDKIFAATGYTYDCALFATTRFKSLVVPHNQKKLTKISSTSFDVSFSGTQAFGGDPYSGPFYERLSQPTQPTLGSFTTSDNKTFTYTGAATLTGTLTVRIIGTFANDITNNLTVYAYAGSGAAFYDFPQDDGFGSDDPFDVTLTLNVTLNNGDLFFLVASRFDDASNFQLNITSISSKIAGASTQPVEINISEAININDTLPKNILQKDFISSIVKLFNLYVFEDYQNDKVLKIEPFVDFYEDATAIDWSNLIDRSKPMRVKPMSELNSRYFEFNFKADSDYYNDLYKKRYNKEYGSYIYDSEFEFANESTKVDVIFSGTPLVGYVGEEKVYSTIFKRNGDVVGVGEESIDSNIRILQTKVVTGVASWDIKDGATNLGSQTQYIYAGHFDDPDAPANDIQFGVPSELFFELSSGAINVNQFNVYWSSYLAEITDKDSRLLIATAKLAYKDIYQLDFSKLIYIDGNLYRLNKIEDFNATEPDTCKVEFLKIINRIY